MRMSFGMKHTTWELGQRLSQGYIDRVPPMEVKGHLVGW
jgi:hypothetical protein